MRTRRHAVRLLTALITVVYLAISCDSSLVKDLTGKQCGARGECNAGYFCDFGSNVCLPDSSDWDSGFVPSFDARQDRSTPPDSGAPDVPVQPLDASKVDACGDAA